MSEPLGLTLAASAGTLIGAAVLSILVSARRRDGDGDDSAADLPVPDGEGPSDEVRRLLLAAGRYRRTAYREYLTARAVLTLGAVAASGMVALMVEPAYVLTAVAGGALVALLAFSLPRVELSAAARSRSRRVEKALPVTVDLLSLSVSGGQSMPAGTALTAEQLKGPYPDMAKELGIVSRHAELHSSEYALDQLAERVQVREVKALALLLVQSERLGADAMDTLQEFNDNLRTQWKQRAEARANRASFWMLLPTIFCLWVAAAIVLIGPPYLEFFKNRDEEIAPLIQQGADAIRDNSPENGQPAQGESLGNR